MPSLRNGSRSQSSFVLARIVTVLLQRFALAVYTEHLSTWLKSHYSSVTTCAQVRDRLNFLKQVIEFGCAIPKVSPGNSVCKLCVDRVWGGAWV